MNSRSEDLTGDTENGCANSGGRSAGPGGLIAKASTIPVDNEEEVKRLIDLILDLKKTLDDLTSRIAGAWKFLPNGLIKNTPLK